MPRVKGDLEDKRAKALAKNRASDLDVAMPWDSVFDQILHDEKECGTRTRVARARIFSLRWRRPGTSSKEML